MQVLDRFSTPIHGETEECENAVCSMCDELLIDDIYRFDGEDHCLVCALEVAGIEKVAG